MKKSILLVDDSALMRRAISDIINTDPAFEVKDVCRDGLSAYEKLIKKQYDGVVLDVNMPIMNGLELLERLQLEHIQATVIMVSTATTKDADVTIRAMELGAVDFVTKPMNIIEAKGLAFRKSLLDVLNAVFSTKQLISEKAFTVIPRRVKTRTVSKSFPKNGVKLVALACSTGGPKALAEMIPMLPGNLNAPIVLVQHMPAGFTKSMADRLDEKSKIRVKEAEDGEVLQNGCVYVAPGGKHLEIIKNVNGQHKVQLNSLPPIGGLRPCANITYDSLCTTDYHEIVCVILTGMGADGTNGILTLERKKPVYVIAQDAQSCVVYGMPKAIYEAGVVDEVVSISNVAKAITTRVGVE
ncbi:MAG: chemotaxis-specific protein-glutamate methyltransferase CheB [Lachnospiraceae bacterium]